MRLKYENLRDETQNSKLPDHNTNLHYKDPNARNKNQNVRDKNRSVRLVSKFSQMWNHILNFSSRQVKAKAIKDMIKGTAKGKELRKAQQ